MLELTFYREIQYSKKDVMDAASRKNMTIEDYINKFGIKRKEKNLGKIKKEQFQIAGTGLQLKLRAAESIDFLKKGKKPVFS